MARGRVQITWRLHFSPDCSIDSASTRIVKPRGQHFSLLVSPHHILQPVYVRSCRIGYATLIDKMVRPALYYAEDPNYSGYPEFMNQATGEFSWE